jgi:hypothetical protein
MTWVVAVSLALVILYLTPVRMVRLYRKDQLTPTGFALTFATGWSLAILVLFYVGLPDCLRIPRAHGQVAAQAVHA